MQRCINSIFLKCPLQNDFFRKLKGYHSSYIRREIHKAWDIHGRNFYPELRKRLKAYGGIRIQKSRSHEWKGGFRFSESWNRYAGAIRDQYQFEQDIKQNKWIVEKGMVEMDEQTWLTLASLSFSKDAEKESPNHLFLKELFKLFAYRMYTGVRTREEVYKKIYGEPVRIDVVANTEKGDIIGEIGGVQLWKIMSLLYLGYTVIIFPHWTNQKNNPFIRKRLHYEFYIFSVGDKNGV